MGDLNVKVTMTLPEMKIFRRALAKAADDGVVDARVALSRICELDELRWQAEEGAPDAAMKSALKTVAMREWAHGEEKGAQRQQPGNGVGEAGKSAWGF
jgi:hypothetical protein